MNAKLLDSRDHLAEFYKAKLAGDVRSHNHIDLVVLASFCSADDIDGLRDEGFIHDGAKGASVGALSATDAPLLIDLGDAVNVRMDRVDFAGGFAGEFVVDNRAELAGFRAESAVDAKVLIDAAAQVGAKANRVAVAGLGAAVSQAAAA